jgi:hypothetical protein
MILLVQLELWDSRTRVLYGDKPREFSEPQNLEPSIDTCNIGKNDETSSHGESGFPGDLTDPGDGRRIWHGTMP